jgi:hypothetical protein
MPLNPRTYHYYVLFDKYFKSSVSLSSQRLTGEVLQKMRKDTYEESTFTWDTLNNEEQAIYKMRLKNDSPQLSCPLETIKGYLNAAPIDQLKAREDITEMYTNKLLK